MAENEVAEVENHILMFWHSERALRPVLSPLGPTKQMPMLSARGGGVGAEFGVYREIYKGPRFFL